MCKKISLLFIAVLLMGGMAFPALGADTLNGKVTKVEGDKITVTLDGTMPSWIKAGSAVTAGGGAPKVLSVKGNDVVLRFSKAKAAKIKVDSTLSVGEFSGDELQGC